MRVPGDGRAWVAAWWRGEGGPASIGLDLLLAPVEAAFRGVVAVRGAGYERRVLSVERVGIPVISVGNVTVGGSGKTPIASWLAGLLRGMGRTPAIVLRGYGADEIAVHRELNPKIAVHHGADRRAAVREAMGEGADCVVLDDGFQHRRLHRDLDIVLVSAEQWSDRRRLLPRGPWREPIAAIRRADYVIVTRKSATRAAADLIRGELRRIAPDVGIGIAHLAPTGLTDLKDAHAPARPLDELAGRRVVAVTTLADPGPFLAQLRSTGAVVESIVFGDHHEFSGAEIERIVERFSIDGGVITRKEAVKLRGCLPEGVTASVVEQGVVLEAGLEDLIRLVIHAVERSE